MFEWLYHLLNGVSPIHPKVCEGRLSPMSFRPYEERDLERCLELYRANEPERFPEGGQDEYKESLEQKSTYILIGEVDGNIVCAGGINHFLAPHCSVLCYGLVHPDHQGRGAGTALTLARLSLLNEEIGQHRVLIFAVEKSIGFYARLGFRRFEPWADKAGKEHPSGMLIFSSEEIQRARKLLKKSGILVPEPPVTIPMHQPLGNQESGKQ